MTHYSACLLIDNGKFLLNKNNLDLPTTPINSDETTESAALRITKEIGIDAVIERFFAINFFSGDQIYTYLCNIKNKENVSNEYGWYRLEDIVNKKVSENLSELIDKINVMV